MRIPRVLTLLLALAILGACDKDANPAGPANHPAFRTLPGDLSERRPDLTGTITHIAVSDAEGVLGFVRVEERPGHYGDYKAVVRVTSGSGLFRVAGRDLVVATFAEMYVGRRAHVWFDGAVAESYPVQGSAAAIVVE